MRSRSLLYLALGLAAAQTLLGLKQTMGQLRRSRYRLGDAIVIATYHPAYVLRQYTREVRAAVWEDLKAAKSWADKGGGITPE